MATQIKEDSLNSNTLQSGFGAPSHLADIGTLFTDKDTGNVYVNRDGAVNWVSIASGGTSGGSGTTLNGTGFVKANGTTITYDNSSYVPFSGSDIIINGSITASSANFSSDTYINSVRIGKGNGNIFDSTVLGFNGLNRLTAGTFNTAIGYSAMANTLATTSTTAVGVAVLANNTTGQHNTAIGTYALLNNTTGGGSTENDNGGNAAVGAYSLFLNTVGNGNTAVGQEALSQLCALSSSNPNSVLTAITTASASINVAIGNFTGNRLFSGSSNVYLGAFAGRGHSYGSSNIFIGTGAGYATGYYTANNNVAIGTSIGSFANRSNCIVIGATAAVPTADNTIRLGNTSITALTTSARITAPSVSATTMSATTVFVSSTFTSSGITRLANSASNKVLIGATPSVGSYSGGTVPDGLTINSDSGGISFLRPTDYAQMAALTCTDGATITIGGGNQNHIDIYGHTSFIARFTNSPSARVGILTSSPQFTLDVSGNTRIVSGLTATTISATSYSNLPNTLYTGDGNLSGNRIVGLGSNTLRFSGATRPNALFINSSGQVGFNNGSPNFTIDLSGNTQLNSGTNSDENTLIVRQTNARALTAATSPYSPNLALHNGSETLNTFNVISFQHGFDINGNRVGVARVGTKLIAAGSGSSNFRGDLFFQVRNFGNILDAMYIQYDGNVGINTTTPSFKLDVNGDTRVTGGLTGNSISLSTSASSISLTNSTQQQIRFFNGGVGGPTLSAYSRGVKIILSDNIDSSISTGYAIGVDAGSLWYGADLTGNGHDWYAGTRKLSSLIASAGFQLFALGGPTTAAMTISGTSALGSKGGLGYMDFLKVNNNYSAATNPNKWFRTTSGGTLEILRDDYNALILSISDSGIMQVGGGNSASTTSNDATTNYLSLNGNGTQIYDDGNTHIHSRNIGGTLWINSNGGGINLGTQSPTSTGSLATSINCGTGAVTGYFNINTGRTFTDSRAYGFLTTGGAGTYPGGSQSVTVSLYATNRIWGQEIDAFSDERMKDIQGEVTLDDGLKLVNKLKPIKYTWKNGDDKGLKVGYSAQQVSKSGFDHLVALMPREGLEETIDDDGFVSPKDTQFSMNYDQVVPYHGVVIKHLLEKIEQLEKDIKDLKGI